MQRDRGFTLVELLLAVAVGLIVLTLAAVSYRDVMRRQRIATASSDLFFAIKQTRAEAIQRGRRVDLAPVDGRDWSRGWAIFIDANGNQRPDEGDTLIHVHDPLPQGISVQAKMTDSGRPYLAYQGSGRTRTNASSQTPQSGSFLLSLDGQQRKIIVNMLGRARLCDPATDKNSC